MDTSWPEESYGGISTENRLRAARDRAALPTAPRAARGPDIDSTKIPDGPPFTAFLGNLSYDVDKDDILEFFGNKKVLWRSMSNTRDSFSSGYPNTEKRVKNMARSGVVLTRFEVFGQPTKHALLCLIYLLSRKQKLRSKR